MNGEESENFEVKVGVHQGSVLSPILFNPLTSGPKKDHFRFTPEDLSEMSVEKSFSAGRPLRDESGKIIFRRKTSARCQISCASLGKFFLLSAGRPLRDASTGFTARRIATNQK